MKGRQHEDEEAGFKHAQPLAGRRVGYPGIVAQALQVQQLSHPSGTELHERAEGREVPNLADLPHIPFDVRLEVVTDPPTARGVDVHRRTKVQFPAVFLGQ